jgi:hypothetical protein
MQIQFLSHPSDENVVENVPSDPVVEKSVKNGVILALLFPMS